MHLLVELYARSLEEATEVLESAARGVADDHLARRGVKAAGGGRREPRPRVVELPGRGSRGPRLPAGPGLLSAQALLQRVELARELRRQVVEFREVLAELGQLGPPLVDVHAQQLGHVLIGDVQPVGVDALAADGRDHADRGLAACAVARAAGEHPREHARVLAVAGPQEAAVLVLAEPVDVEDLRQHGPSRRPIFSQCAK